MLFSSTYPVMLFWAAILSAKLGGGESSYLSFPSSTNAAKTACTKIPAPCSKRQICAVKKEEPYYECLCKAGYVAVDGSCLEENPCRFCGTFLRKSYCPCPSYMTCNVGPEVGQHTCACKGNYGLMCQDKADPCYLAGCHKNAMCRKFGDKARCFCKPGFAGDGKTCLAKYMSCNTRCGEVYGGSKKKSASAVRYFWQAYFMQPKLRQDYETIQCRCDNECIASNSCCEDFRQQCL